MRKLLLVIFPLFIGLHANAQTIPNGGFESWTPIPLWEEPIVNPSTFGNTNYEVLQYSDDLTLTKVTRNGAFAMRLENIVLTKGQRKGETEGGVAIWGGGPNDQMTFAGGFPFTDQNVTGLVGRFNYDLSAASPGLILIQFKKDGVPVGGDPFLGQPFYVFQLTGSSAGFAEETFNLTAPLPEVPDSVVVAFTSFNPFEEGTPAEPGKFLELDSLYLTSSSGNSMLPGGDLDTWVALPDYEFPDEWEEYLAIWPGGPTFSKTTDSYAGTYALQLMTIASESYIETGEAGLGYYTDDESVPPGFPGGNIVPGAQINGMPQEFSFAYKYTVPDGEKDTALVSIAFTRWDESVQQRIFIGHFAFKLEPASDFTTVSQTFSGGTFPDEPDSMLVNIVSSLNWDDSPNEPQVGSVLIIDEIALLTNSITGSSVSFSEQIQVYPVPASSSVSIKSPAEITGAVIMNSLSVPVISEAGTGKKEMLLDVSSLKPGVYFVRLETEAGILLKKIIKE